MVIVIYKTNSDGVRAVDWFTGTFTIYDIRTMRGKMNNLFGKDAFSKGHIELLDYGTKESEFVYTKEELNSLEGK